MLEFEKAKDKIMMGAERRSMVMKESEKEMTAYHEAGHAIIGRWCRIMTPSTRSPSFRAVVRWV
jgi:ATP-dependent Zn protease